MARTKTESGLSAKTEAKALELLCEGHDAGTVAADLDCDYRLVCLLSISPVVLEAIEAGRRRRLEIAARNAEKQSEEWAEQDRQEKEAATAIESAAIQLVPRKIAGLDVEARGVAVCEIQRLADTVLKAQKARRIASNRPIERTEVESNTQEAFLRRVERAAGLADADDKLDGRAADGVRPAPATTPDTTKPGAV